MCLLVWHPENATQIKSAFEASGKNLHIYFLIDWSNNGVYSHWMCPISSYNASVSSVMVSWEYFPLLQYRGWPLGWMTLHVIFPTPLSYGLGGWMMQLMMKLTHFTHFSLYENRKYLSCSLLDILQVSLDNLSFPKLARSKILNVCPSRTERAKEEPHRKRKGQPTGTPACQQS